MDNDQDVTLPAVDTLPMAGGDRSALPLVIDLDGTLLKTNSLDETLLEGMRQSPFATAGAFMQLLKGRAAFKAQLARMAAPDVKTWPIDERLVAFAEHEATAGRRVVLMTAADQAVAEAVAARFPFIDEVIASDGFTSLKGQAKAERLSAMFPQGFLYAGARLSDLAVWRASSGAIVVNAAGTVRRQAEHLGKVIAVFPPPRIGFGILRRALRLHQWAKNALVFVPLVLAGKVFDLTAWTAALIGFLALGPVASASYLINDLWDLPADRQHWSKQQRPLARGDISIRGALLMAVAGMVLGFAMAAAAGAPAVVCLAIYLAGTLGYSFYFKCFPILDVFVIASLFTLRLGYGIVLTNVRLSPWLLVFSMFLFLSLSMAKRHTEVLRLADRGKESAVGRGYRLDDAPLNLGMGLAAMFGATLILVLYLIEDAFPQGVYANPSLLWAMPPILFLFLGRVWLFAQRGLLYDDPVAFALKDRVSLGLGLTMALVVFAAVVHV